MVGEGVQERKAVEDYRREARVLAALHPGIPNLIDSSPSAGAITCNGIHRGRRPAGMAGPARRRRRVRESQVLRWARELLDVLSFLHSRLRRSSIAI